MTTQTEPILLVSSSYGIYTGQMLAEKINYSYDDIFLQMKHQISANDLKDLLDGPENENYLEAFNDVENYIEVIIDGKQWVIITNEDLWLCPIGYDFDII